MSNPSHQLQFSRRPRRSSISDGSSSDEDPASQPVAPVPQPSSNVPFQQVEQDLDRLTRTRPRRSRTSTKPHNRPGPLQGNVTPINVHQDTSTVSLPGPGPQPQPDITRRHTAAAAPDYRGTTFASDGRDSLYSAIGTTPQMMYADSVRRSHRPSNSGEHHFQRTDVDFRTYQMVDPSLPPAHDPTILPDTTRTLFSPSRQTPQAPYIRSNPSDPNSPLVPTPGPYHRNQTPQQYHQAQAPHLPPGQYPQYQQGTEYNRQTSLPFGTLPPIPDWQSGSR
ncbi:hypothetical protein B0H10DRAFT_2231697 [Mycena sp. CBHHK59/15]|nr:hypothetical protein B0H10DRAFT_2231697 [Mycena sp. CBHHK59/15]